jgi:hypothetical protein
MNIIYDLAVVLLGVYLEKNQAHVPQETSRRMLIVAAFVISNTARNLCVKRMHK